MSELGVTMPLPDEGGDDNQWLTAYADLISAILAVVVLMLSFAPVDMEELVTAVEARAPKSAEPLREIQERLEKVVEENGLQDKVVFDYDLRGLEVSFIDAVSFFETGSAILDLEAVVQYDPVLEAVGEIGGERFIDINGHTDDTGSNDTNWRLSSERSLAMLHYMEQTGLSTDGAKLIAYADTFPREPIDGLVGSELEDARSQNRRISILIHQRRPQTTD